MVLPSCSTLGKCCQAVAVDACATEVQHYLVAPRKDWRKSTLGERIKHVADMRGVSLNKLGALAGIASGPMSRLSRKDEQIAASPETLVKLADAAAVNLTWLANGVGPIERAAAKDSFAILQLCRSLQVDSASNR